MLITVGKNRGGDWEKNIASRLSEKFASEIFVKSYGMGFDESNSVEEKLEIMDNIVRSIDSHYNFN